MQKNTLNKEPKNNVAIALFFALWCITGVVIIALPIEVVFGQSIEIALVIIAFVALVSCSALIWRCTPIFRITEKTKKLKPMSIQKMRFIIKLAFFNTFIGNALVLFDRIVYRGIDYSEGARAARYQWLQSDVSGSVFSVVGNLMIPFSYCALFIGIYHWESLTRSEKIFAFVAGLGGQIGLVMINGGRSNLLMVLAFSFAICVLRKYQGKTFLPKIRGKIIIAIVLATILFSYLESIFFAFSENTENYLRALALSLGARVDTAYSGGDFTNLLIETCLYLVHGNFTIGAVLESGPNLIQLSDINHNMTFRALFDLLGRFPFFDYQMQLPSFDSGVGAFNSAPGIFLYDYGYAGFVVVSVIFGILFAEAIKVMTMDSSEIGIGRIVFCVAVLINVYLSMVGLGMNIGYFWFMVFGMVATEFIARIKFEKSTWMVLTSKD